MVGANIKIRQLLYAFIGFYILIFVLVLGLSLDGYCYPIVPKMMVLIAILTWFALTLHNFFGNSKRGELLQTLFNVDLNHGNNLTFMYFLYMVVGATPTYVLTHNYDTVGPPSFFPLVLMPLFLITLLLLIITRKSFSKCRLFMILTIIFLLDMILTGIIPSVGELSGGIALLKFRMIYAYIMIIVAAYYVAYELINYFSQSRSVIDIGPLGHTQDATLLDSQDDPGGSTSLRIHEVDRANASRCSIIAAIILLVVSGSLLLILLDSDWLWKNYEVPGIDDFPQHIFIGEERGTYVPIVSHAEFRDFIIPEGINTYYSVVEINTTRCSDFPQSPNSIINTGLWITACCCPIIESSLEAQNRGYDAVFFRSPINVTDIIVNKDVGVAIFSLSSGLGGPPHNAAPSYTVITRPPFKLWWKPISYSLTLLPLMIGIITITVFVIILTGQSASIATPILGHIVGEEPIIGGRINR
jgi:hypothetical protein